MDKIFYVIDASVADMEIDSVILKRLQRKEFGRMAGISVVSHIHDFSKGVLSIITEIKYIGIENDVQFPGITGSYQTIFKFHDPKYFTSGSDDKFTVLEKCYHLAQGNAYGMISQQATENGLALPSMEPTPAEKLKEMSTEFLNKQ